MEVRGQLHALAAFTPRERAPGTHWIGGWMGLRAVVDTVVKRKIPSPCWELNPTKEYIWLLVRRCRRQCNEELHNLCVMRSAYKILGRDPQNTSV
jgi:hypothetical protein